MLGVSVEVATRVVHLTADALVAHACFRPCVLLKTRIKGYFLASGVNGCISAGLLLPHSRVWVFEAIKDQGVVLVGLRNEAAFVEVYDEFALFRIDRLLCLERLQQLVFIQMLG